MKEFEFTTNNKKIFAILFVILVNALMVFIFIESMYHVFKPSASHEITKNEFIGELEKRNCKVIDKKVDNKNEGVNIYLITDETSCPYLVSYTTFNNEDTKLQVASAFANEVLNKNENLNNENTINFFNKYIEYNSTGKYFKSFTMYKNSILYGSTDRQNKQEMMNIFQKFHYRYIPDISPLKNLYYILLINICIILISYWQIEKKCGKKGWIIFVPFYNYYDLFKNFLGNGWLSLTMYIPVINVFSLDVLHYRMAKCFSKNDGICVLNIFLPNVFLPMIAFDDSKYTKVPFRIRKNIKDKTRINANVPHEKKEIKNLEKPKLKKEIKISIIFKWVLTIPLLVFGVLVFVAYLDDFKLGGFLFGILLIIYGLMACPSISNNTKKYPKYTKYKKIIVGILIIINLIILEFLSF